MKKIPGRIFYVSILCCLGIILINGSSADEFLPKQFSIQQVDTSLIIKRSSFNDSTIIVAAGRHYKKNMFHDFLVGKHYRDIWATPVEVKVFDIGTSKGGMKIIKKGGNQQTLSLRMEGGDGKTYVLRTVDKDHGNVLPVYLRKSIISHIFRDQASAVNPYGAQIIPALSRAAGINHVSPELVFIPYDKRFGEFAEEFEGRMAYLEEFPNKTWSGESNFGLADNIFSSANFLERRFSSQIYQVDVKYYLKCRLFDILIGDWDRHEGQWRWAMHKQDEEKIFRPIPRDRDIAFFLYHDGLLNPFSLLIMPKLQSFDYEVSNMSGMIRNAVYLDALLLSELTREDFISAAQELAESLPDEVIESAVKLWPDKIYKQIGKETGKKLKSRRNKLTELAKDFYKLTAEKLTIAGTDEAEVVEISRLNHKETEVTIYDQTRAKVLFHRKINHRETREVNIYTLGGNDRYLIYGKARRGIRINLYGGEGDDHYEDRSKTDGFSSKARIYDDTGNNIFLLNNQARIFSERSTAAKAFSRTGRKRVKN